MMSKISKFKIKTGFDLVLARPSLPRLNRISARDPGGVTACLFKEFIITLYKKKRPQKPPRSPPPSLRRRTGASKPRCPMRRECGLAVRSLPRPSAESVSGFDSPRLRKGGRARPTRRPPARAPPPGYVRRPPVGSRHRYTPCPSAQAGGPGELVLRRRRPLLIMVSGRGKAGRGASGPGRGGTIMKNWSIGEFGRGSGMQMRTRGSGVESGLSWLSGTGLR